MNFTWGMRTTLASMATGGAGWVAQFGELSRAWYVEHTVYEPGPARPTVGGEAIRAPNPLYFVYEDSLRNSHRGEIENDSGLPTR